MRFKHQFRVNAPLGEVVDFHRDARGLKALTPPLAFMQYHQLPDPIAQGDMVSFTMWMGPLPVFWEAHFTEITDTGFVDTQGKGPFRSWQHKHHFIEIQPGITEVHDHIEAQLDTHLWRAFIGLQIWLTLPLLFWYRQRQTRRLLEK